jgi:glycosyltransferase involved in cell wall biosynthesis
LLPNQDLAINIFWDGYGLENPASGVFQSAYRLFMGLKSLDVNPRVLSPVVLPAPFGRVQQNSTSLFVPGRIAKLKPVWPILSLRRMNQDARLKNSAVILHGLSNLNLPLVGSKASKWRFVLTVHDTIPLMEGTGLQKKSVLQYKWLLPKAALRADAIITVSEWSKSCLEERYPFVRGKVHVIRNGFMPLADGLPIQKSTSEVIRTLTIARGEPYKRLDRLIAFYRMYSERLNCTLVTDQSGIDLFCIMAPDLLDSGTFRIYQNADTNLLQSLYANSDVYVHPSIYEGFCMPAAEAISYGLPVVYQKGSGIDEVAGTLLGIGLEAESSVEDWLQAIETAYLRSLSPDWHSKLIYDLAQQPSWNQSAEDLKLLYARLLGA